MRNLIAFFRRFRVFLVFVLLQVISLSTYFSFLQYPRAQYLTSASSISGSILKARFDLTKHFNLSKNNIKLQEENIALRKKQPMSFIRMQNGLVRINDTLFDQQYEYIPATVINSTLTKRNNYFTLNVGYAQGVKRGMGVFSENGIVGIIHNSSKHFAVVKSVLTENINIDVMVEPLGLFGLMKWDGGDPRFGNITGISNDLKLKKWLKVVTRGGSGIFPRGLTVGHIAKLKPVEGKPLWDVVIKYSEDYRTLQHVYVIRNLLSEEQHQLEVGVPNDEEDRIDE
jgi:rod shape-determining protein MreC